jgi:hypothetical protein
MADSDPDPDPEPSDPAPQPDQPTPKAAQEAPAAPLPDQPVAKAEQQDSSDSVPQGGSESTEGQGDQPEAGSPDAVVPKAQDPTTGETPEATQERYIKHQIGIWQKAQADAERAQAHTQQGLVDLDKQRIAETQANPRPQNIPLAQRPMEERKANTFLTWALPAALALGIAAFGSRGKRGGYLMAGFLGSAMKAYSEGKTDQQKIQLQHAEQMRKDQKEDNDARQKSYNEIMQDKRYSYEQKRQLLQDQGNAYGDKATVAAAQGNLQSIRQQLNQNQKAAQKSAVDQRKAIAMTAQLLLKDPSHMQWQQELQKRFNAKNGRFAHDPSELFDEEDALPFKSWMAQQGKADDTKENAEAKKAGVSTGTEDWHKALDEAYGPSGE